jgi:hypothetical protein
MSQLNLTIAYVPASRPACPIEDCGIEPIIRVVAGKVRVTGACSHFLRLEILDDQPMVGYADY